jgi:rubrerythrin
MAVLRSGEKNTVFVALDGGHFEPRMVTLGARAEGGMYQVVSGLEEGERVVTSGQFMLDSESQLREAIQKMVRPNAPAPAMEQSGRPSNSVPSTATALHAASADLTAAYICPMPEHVSLEYDHPGKCPICGMALVPVTRDMLARIQPGGQLEYYTCPMPEHSDIREAKAGKCPRCGMTLIPVMVRPKAVPEPAAKPAPEQTSGSTKLYTCPMAQHADVVSDAPGVCPKCEMKLVETSTVRHGKIAEEHWHKQPAKSASPPAAPSPAHSH